MLAVRQADGGWYEIEVLGTGELGWVHSGYTRALVVDTPSPVPPWFSRLRGARWLRGLIYLVGAVALLGFLSSGIRPRIGRRRFVELLVGSLVVGVFFVLNTVGEALADSLGRFVEIEILSPIWEINALLSPRIGLPFLIACLLGFTTTFLLLSWQRVELRLSFLQGLGSGFLALPVTVLAIALLLLVGWVLLQVLKLVGFLLGIVAIPIAWLWEHVVLPLLRLLGTPFVWLWEHWLQELLAPILAGLRWIGEHLIAPIYQFVLAMLQPVLRFLVAVLVACGGLAPFSVIGLALIYGFRTALRARLDNAGYFAQGVTLGLLLLDAGLSWGLDAAGLLTWGSPSWGLLVVSGIPLLALLRVLTPSLERPLGQKVAYGTLVGGYLKESNVELLAECLVKPAFVLGRIALPDFET